MSANLWRTDTRELDREDRTGNSLGRVFLRSSSYVLLSLLSSIRIDTVYIQVCGLCEVISPHLTGF